MQLTLNKYKRIRPWFRSEPLNSTAFLLDKLLGMTRGSQGGVHFGWQMEAYLDIPGIRVAAEKTDSELEDIV